MDSTPFNLFAYGTLKRGFGNHKRFCRGAVQVTSARVWGRLYLLKASYPALEVPGECILAYATGRAHEDSQACAEANADAQRGMAMTEAAGDWGWVHGEILCLTPSDSLIAALDDLEGFVPGKGGLYSRVLTYAHTNAALVAAWMYVQMGEIEGQRLHAGQWPDPAASRSPVDNP